MSRPRTTNPEAITFITFIISLHLEFDFMPIGAPQNGSQSSHDPFDQHPPSCMNGDEPSLNAWLAQGERIRHRLLAQISVGSKCRYRAFAFAREQQNQEHQYDDVQQQGLAASGRNRLAQSRDDELPWALNSQGVGLACVPAADPVRECRRREA